MREPLRAPKVHLIDTIGIGSYIADFLARKAKLVVEVDDDAYHQKCVDKQN